MTKQLMTTTATRPGDRVGDTDRQKTAARLGRTSTGTMRGLELA